MDNKTIFALILLAGFVAYTFAQRGNSNPRVFYCDWMVNNYNGYIVPPIGVFISKKQRENVALLEHELVHWKQFQREGILPFLFNYAKQAVNLGYDKNPYEIEARTVENEYCKRNYTECVRKGNSNTVHNPNFRS